MHPDTELQPAPMAHSAWWLPPLGPTIVRTYSWQSHLVVLCVELWAVCRWVGGVVGMVLAVFVVV
jgi:hypothetical protein